MIGRAFDLSSTFRRHLQPSDPIDSFDYDAALNACAKGDRMALQQIYQRESRYLLGVALRIVRQRQHAEDVLHDAFMSIWQRASSFDSNRGAAKGWIYTVVRHAALNWVRSHSREVSVDEESTRALEDESSMEAYTTSPDPYESRVDLGKLNGCLSQLDAPRRDCIVLAYLDGCSHSEIAQRVEKPLGTVKAWISRSMKSLRECMG